MKIDISKGVYENLFKKRDSYKVTELLSNLYLFIDSFDETVPGTLELIDAKVDGFDFSRASVELKRSKFPKLKPYQRVFAQNDGYESFLTVHETLPFGNESFTYDTVQDVLDYID